MPAPKTTAPDIRIASPCKASWDAMKGDDAVRFCGQCEKNVYNISVLSAGEIRDLVERKEGRLCVRLYRRADGTILTDDCPVGLRWLRRKVALVATAVSALLIHSMGGASFIGRRMEGTWVGRQLTSWFGSSPWPGLAIQGKVQMPSPPVRDPGWTAGAPVMQPPSPPVTPPQLGGVRAPDPQPAMPEMGEPPPLDPTVEVEMGKRAMPVTGAQCPR